MKLLLVFALIHLVAALQGVTRENCRQRRILIESALNNIYGFSNDQLPANTVELAEFCTGVRSMYNVFMSYQKCLQEFPGKVFTASTRSTAKVMEKSCGGEEDKMKLLKLFQCLNNNEKTGKMIACSIGTRNVLDQLADSGEDQPFTASFCCLSLLNEDCLAKRISQLSCEDGSVKLGKHHTGVCQDYKTIAACEAKIPNEFAQFKVMVFNETAKEGERSMLKSLMKVAVKVSPQTSK